MRVKRTASAASRRPELKALVCNPPRVEPETAQRIAAELFGLEGPVRRVAGERDCNYVVEAPGRSAVLKLSPFDESGEAVDFQTSVLLHLAARDCSLGTPRVIPTRDGKAYTQVSLEGVPHFARAVSWLPGVPLEDRSATPGLLEEIGAGLASLDLALRGFFHPAAKPAIAWDIMRARELRAGAEALGDRDLRDLAARAYDRVLDHGLPALERLRAQVIHNDAHPGNVLVTDVGEPRLTGLIDFGDMLHAPLVMEIAVAAAETLVPGLPVIESASLVLSGYGRVAPVEEAEIDVLYDAMLARCAATLAIQGWRARLDPGNTEHLQPFLAAMSRTLDELMTLGPAATAARLRKAASPLGYWLGQAAVAPLSEPEATGKLLARRKRLLGPHLELSYEHPVRPVRGRGPYLFDAEGRRYLDAYNNVPQVGHAHPHVVEAIARQAARLNTNTRYLYDSVLDYAERLTARMPPGSGLDTCVFVNCGSEANDVAWRIARHWTGGSGGLVMANAYHGGTEAVAALSPYDEQGRVLAPHIRTLEAPDTYRGRFAAGDAGAGAGFAADADRAIAELGRAGHRLAAWIVDTGFTSNGLITPPADYVAAVAAKVRAAGGLVIADEVQFGFARSGTHFWGFDLHGVAPDLVTMGKPVGNGFPLGVIVTRAELLARFAKETNYFSTFGGNPVAAAAGIAVLEVIEREGLQANALATGGYLRDGLAQLMTRHRAIGDVRGQGLKIGVELVKDRATKSPDRALARSLANGMRDAGVLIGTEGVLGNVLKIRPPLPFRPADADELIGKLDVILGSTTGAVQ